jgi:hypothetical protein
MEFNIYILKRGYNCTSIYQDRHPILPNVTLHEIIYLFMWSRNLTALSHNAGSSMAGGGSRKIVFPAWLQLMTMLKHKMLENILSIPCKLFQPVNLNFL